MPRVHPTQPQPEEHVIEVTRTVKGLDEGAASKVADVLQVRLRSLIDLQTTLKHVHWNVVGPNFIGVHEMLDPQTAGVREMTDALAERIATLGGEPNGLVGHVAEHRTWDDYPLGRASVPDHLRALDSVYDGIVSSHREAIEQTADLDPISEDLLTGQTADLELYQWFVRAHLESAG